MRSRRTGVALLSITLAVSLASLGAHTHVAPAAGARDVPLGRPATVWVDDDWTSGSCGGHTWQVDAFKVIQNGIDGVAASGGTVIVYPGTYTENIDFKGKAITVRSMEPLEPGAVNLTIIDGNDAGSVVTFDSGETSSSQLIGFTVRNGQAAEGAGIYCNLSSPTISSNVITLNDAVSGTGYAYGGGIYCWASSPDIIGNDVGGNMADRDGGGIYCENVSSPTISDNEIYYNTAGYAGGGIYCDSSSPAITGNNIYYNDAYEAGGGIACLDSASPTIAGNDIHHNGAVVSPDDPPDWCRYGGGIYCTSSSPMITGNQIRHNVVEGRGGGICCTSSSAPTISGNTIHDNDAWLPGSDPDPMGGPPSGAGIHCDASSPTIADNDIYDNASADQGGGIGCTSGSSPAISGNGIRGNTAKSGGGIYCHWSSPTISQTIISGNSAAKGGGVHCTTSGSAPSITNATICSNSATDSGAGGGVHCEDGSITMRNCIIAYTADGTGARVEGAGAVVVTYCLVYGNPEGNYSGMTDPTGTNGNLVGDPCFANPGADDYHLKSTQGRWNPSSGTWAIDSVHSPCIDTGDPADALGDEPVPNGGRINMGAYGNTVEASRSYGDPSPPTLSWVGAPGYESDGVDPDAGEYPVSMFTFEVKITDADGNLPTTADIELWRDGSPWRVKHLTKKRSSGPVDGGADYRYRRRLAPGEWRYRFIVSDDDGDATGEPCQWMDGPHVVPRLNQRPDGAVWNGARWVGENYYNTSGYKQRVNGEIAAGGSIDYTVRVENDRADPDTLVVKGTGSKGVWTIAYFTGANVDITGDVTGSGWTTPSIAGRGSTTITVRMTAASGASPGAEKATWVQVGRAAWGPTKYAGFADTVKMVTTVEGAAATGTMRITGLTALPTNVGAQVQFALSSAAQVDARVMNIAGRPIKTICTARDGEAGANTLLWNAMSDDGLRVPSGVYLVEIEARGAGGSQSRALTQVRLLR